MARPKRFRSLTLIPPVTRFLPAGCPDGESSLLDLRLEELETIRLIDIEGLSQERAARRMAISRQTVGRILAAGRRTVAEALVHGKGICVRGGVYRYEQKGQLTCPRCHHRQPLVRSVRRTVPCRKCCGPVQSYQDVPAHQKEKGDFMELKNVKIAIASDDGRNVSSHFGRAPLYTVLTMKDGEVAGREQRPKLAPHASGGHADDHAPHSAHHSAMVEPILDCQVVIARGMGDGAYIHLTESGLTVILSQLHSVDEVAAAIRSGSLEHQPQRLHEHGRPGEASHE